MTCNCGCNTKAVYLASGVDYDPNGPGREFKDEPMCFNAAMYCKDSAEQLALPLELKLIP